VGPKLTEWRWASTRHKRSLLLRGKLLDRKNLSAKAALIDRLWSEKGSGVRDTVICERDSCWYEQRFFSKANKNYFGYLLAPRIVGNAIGLVIFQQQKDELEILDLLCKPERLDHSIEWSVGFAARVRCRSVFLWASENLERFINPAGANKRRLDLFAASNIFASGPAVDSIRGKWWLTGGDTNFR